MRALLGSGIAAAGTLRCVLTAALRCTLLHLTRMRRVATVVCVIGAHLNVGWFGKGAAEPPPMFMRARLLMRHLRVQAEIAPCRTSL